MENTSATRLLHDACQSLWLDNITRTLLDAGTLRRYIEEFSVTGLTSNPTIFDHAIRIELCSSVVNADQLYRDEAILPEEAKGPIICCDSAPQARWIVSAQASSNFRSRLSDQLEPSEDEEAQQDLAHRINSAGSFNTLYRLALGGLGSPYRKPTVND
jgi:transaldolase